MPKTLKISILSLTLLVGLATIGCQPTKEPPGENSARAGGNGSFGETPASPGQYVNDPKVNNGGSAPDQSGMANH